MKKITTEEFQCRTEIIINNTVRKLERKENSIEIILKTGTQKKICIY